MFSLRRDFRLPRPVASSSFHAITIADILRSFAFHYEYDIITPLPPESSAAFHVLMRHVADTLALATLTCHAADAADMLVYILRHFAWPFRFADVLFIFISTFTLDTPRYCAYANIFH